MHRKLVPLDKVLTRPSVLQRQKGEDHIIHECLLYLLRLYCFE